ncbi:MAG: EthD family reductase [Halanaeroarchaeum sp.]
MRKLVNLLVRKQGMGHEEFRSYWLEEHAPLAADLPGVRRYATSLPADPEKAAYDGIAELYLEPDWSVGEVFSTDVGREIQADTENFADEASGEVLVVDETVQFDGDA